MRGGETLVRTKGRDHEAIDRPVSRRECTPRSRKSEVHVLVTWHEEHGDGVTGEGNSDGRRAGGEEERRPPANDVARCHGKSIRRHRPPLSHDDHPPQCNDLQTGKILQREVSEASRWGSQRAVERVEEVAWMRKRRRVKGATERRRGALVPFEENSRGFTGCPRRLRLPRCFSLFYFRPRLSEQRFSNYKRSISHSFFSFFFSLVRSSFLSLRVVLAAKVRRVSRGTRALVRTSAICRMDISLYRSISGSRRMRERRRRIYSLRSLFLFLALSFFLSLRFIVAGSFCYIS